MLIVLYSRRIVELYTICNVGINLASGNDDYIPNIVWAAPGLLHHPVEAADQWDPGLSVDGRDA